MCFRGNVNDRVSGMLNMKVIICLVLLHIDLLITNPDDTKWFYVTVWGNRKRRQQKYRDCLCFILLFLTFRVISLMFSVTVNILFTRATLC